MAELKDMTEDQWGINLFAEASDQQMAKIAMKFLATKDLKIFVHENEDQGGGKLNLVCRTRKKCCKVAAIQREKFCSNCESRTHETRDFWGKCPYCGKYN